jgi:cytochrome c-type biogenesis protein CcmH
MILWIVLTAMSSVAAMLVAIPFIRRVERRRAEQALEFAVYRDQLKEVDSEAGQGLIDAPQAEAAKQEIKRRVLASARDADTLAPGLSSSERTFAAIGVAAVVVFGSIGLFALTVKMEPSAEVQAADQGAEPTETSDSSKATGTAVISAGLSSTMAPLNRPSATRADAPAITGKQKALPPVDEMIQRIVKRLEANPKDAGGWRMLGWSYAGVERFPEAAEAYAKAIALTPKVAGLQSARADALIQAAKGIVTPEAKSSISEALSIDPKDVRGRYLNGLIKEQEGDKTGALAEWSQLIAEGDPSDPFIQELKQKVPGAETASVRSEKGPTAQDVKNAEAMDPAGRNEMIKNMVNALATRLDKTPHDADGWIKLLKSRVVLKENEEAKRALERALEEFGSESPDRDRIVTTARELGLRE